MLTMKKTVLILILVIRTDNIKVENPLARFSPCPGTDIVALYRYGDLPLAEENQYDVVIPLGVREKEIHLLMTFDKKAVISTREYPSEFVEWHEETQNNIVNVTFLNLYDYSIKFNVKGVGRGITPYIITLKMNGVDHCKKPVLGYLDKTVQEISIATRMLSERLSVSVNDCGRRKLDFNQLIAGGQSSKAGDWPWHVAIYRNKGGSRNYTYICGGTLISKLFVLTAAHCTTINKVSIPPETLKVYLGKYQLYNDDASSEEREVFSVTVHEDFPFSSHLDNDIALLKLKTEAVYSDYVHPACIWSSSASIKTAWKLLMGTVVGWGRYDPNTSYLTTELKQTNLPMLSNEQCLQKDSTFYGNFLSDGKKFCAGWGNGSSPCNGDSGGGYMIYVPDTDNSTSTGAWYVRGVVSVGKTFPGTNSCDPSYYSVFTDTKIYENWILNKTICSCFPPVARALCAGAYGNMKTVDSC